jgi:hypothetical protein
MTNDTYPTKAEPAKDAAFSQPRLIRWAAASLALGLVAAANMRWAGHVAAAELAARHLPPPRGNR